jgi:NADP-dependent 3-hydroxy acid dehydrogenase YdfG
MTVTVITGTSTGIGLATTVRLAKHGHKVYAGVRNPTTATVLQAAIDQSDGAIEMLTIDVTDEKSIQTAISKVLTAEGRIDVLINNAGIGRGSAIEETDLSAVRDLFDTNFFGLVAVTKAVLPGMRERQSGTIVNISSIAGRYVTPMNAFYAASKHAVEAFSESLASQMSHFNVRVAIVEPGVIATAIFENSRNAQDAPDPNSPYAVHARRVAARFAKGLADGVTSPETAAEIIENAINTDDPKLRYLVGKDAEDIWAARQRVSDELFITNASIEDDEEYFDAMQDMLGQDLFRS